MRKNLLAGTMALALLAGTGTARADKPAPTPAIPPAMVKLEKSLKRQTGDVTIDTAKVVLHLGKGYYYLDPDDTRRVLTELWGNPPDTAANTLGMVLPADQSALDNVWGAVITYQSSGHVSDDDANSADYSELLRQAQQSAENSNAERTKAGFPAIHLVGWAQPPSYDAGQHAVIWARDIRFTGAKIDTLNYDVRL